MTGIWDMLGKGGIMIYPLILASIVGLAVIFERAFNLRRRRIIRSDLLAILTNFKKPEDVRDAVERMQNRSDPFIEIIRAGLSKAGQPRDQIKEAIQDRGRREIHTLERGLVILETVAQISPLMGLLGTVLGMIKVFRVVSEQGLGQTQALSSGISEALITTVVGLAIAIPVLVAYNYFSHRVEDMVMEIEEHSARFLDRLSGTKET